MKISYKTNKFEKICSNFSKTQKEYGEQIAKKLHQRIDELKASKTFGDALKIRSLRLHELKGNYKGKYGADLTGNYRLILIPVGDDIEIEKIEEVNLEEIVDYH